MPGFDRVNSLHLMVGGFQAVLAYGLYEAADHSVWPATHAAAFIPLFMLMVFFPFAFYCASSALTVRRWMISFAIALLAAGVGLYQGLTVSGLAASGVGPNADWSATNVEDYLLQTLILGLALFLLVPALALYRKELRVSYLNWVHALLQNAHLLAQALLVLLLFWAVLWTAAALFDLVGLPYLHTLLGHSWFFIPLSVLVFSHGVSLAVRNHSVGDYVSERLARLCGWLYPMAALLGAGFVLSWLAQGIDALLATGHAANLLLWFTTLSLLLLNMTVRSASATAPLSRWLSWVTLAGVLALLPMTLVAAYALGLRVEQYGLTPLRIWAGFVNLLLLMLVSGYLLHALLQLSKGVSRWMAISNVVAAAMVVAGIVLMLGGPLDPRRISVADQMARSHERPGMDDAALIRFLKHQGGRFGTDQLLQLAKRSGEEGSVTALRAELARQALENTAESRLDAHEVVASLPVLPEGVRLPADLQAQLGDISALYTCVGDITAADACLIWQLQLHENGPTEYVVLSRAGRNEPPFGMLWRSVDGNWESAGSLELDDMGCPPRNGAREVFAAVVRSEVRLQAKKQRDLMVNGVRVATRNWLDAPCE